LDVIGVDGKVSGKFVFDLLSVYARLAPGVMLVIIAASALLPALRVLRIEPARALNME